MKYSKPLALMSLLLATASPVWAGGDISGGANATPAPELDLLDFAEAVRGGGKVPFSPQKVPAFSIVERVLKRLKDIYQEDFREELEEVLYQKTWYFVQTPIPPAKGEKIHVLLDEQGKVPVAIQDTPSITMNQPWFKSRSELRQAGTFIHEAIMGLALKYDIDRNQVRGMTRVLFAEELGGHFPDGRQFWSALQEFGFDKVLLVRQSKRAAQAIAAMDKMKSAVATKNVALGQEAFSAAVDLYIQAPLTEKLEFHSLNSKMGLIYIPLQMHGIDEAFGSKRPPIDTSPLDPYYERFRTKLYPQPAN